MFLRPIGILIPLLCIGASEIGAQDSQEVACGPAAAIVPAVDAKFTALAQATMPGPRGDMPVKFYANASTGAWVVLVFPTPGVACFKDGGEHFGPIIPEKPGRRS